MPALWKLLFFGAAVSDIAAPLPFADIHAKDLTANPSDLAFQLTVGGQRFHIGQRIVLQLSLSSSSREKYRALTSNFDRSGRLQSEQFVFDATNNTGIRDPSSDYFGSGVTGGIGGGPRGSAILEAKPVDIEFPLNDWIRFDQAGRYRLYLKTHRLSRERTSSDAPGESLTVHFAATSNIIEVEILHADPGWQAQKLNELRALFEGLPKNKHAFVPPDQKTIDGRAELRYLGTPAAVELSFELARREARIDTLLLVGARNRPAMLVSFDAYLADPEVEVQEWDIRLRVMFRYIERDKVEPLPFALWQTSGKTWQDVVAMADTRRVRYDEILREESVRMIPVVSIKKHAGKQSLIETIARLAPDAARQAGLVEPDPLDLPREKLIDRFITLTEEQQEKLLHEKWDSVRGPAMIPVLREVLRKTPVKPFGESPMMLNVWGVGGIEETALLRLAELAPTEARLLVFSRLAAGDAAFGSYATRMLTPEPLLAADEAFTKAIEAKALGAMPLIARFGSATLLPAMREIYGTDHGWPCAAEEGFLGYFVRVAAPPEARRMLNAAMGNREKRGCYRMLLTQISSIGRRDVIEAQALTMLQDDLDTEGVMSAAQVLASGGPEIEGRLWKRLEQWSAKWRGREVELHGRPIQGGGNQEESRLGDALFRALSSAKSWIIDESRRKRLLSLCVDEWCRQRWSKERGPAAVRVEVSSGGNLYPTTFRMEDYGYPRMDELKEKMAQYPKGTVFRWCPQQENPFDFMSEGQREDLYREIAAFAAGASLTIEPYSKGSCAAGAK